jgi:hypothetical protein
MSKRSDRLRTRAIELRAAESVAQIRLSNAERCLFGSDTNTNMSRLELDAARTALRGIHEEQQQIIKDLDIHTTELPDLALILVDDPNGPRVVERRDTDETHWHELGAPADRPMDFDIAIGVTPENPRGWEFYRLYTQDEVDDLLDAALGL